MKNLTIQIKNMICPSCVYVVQNILTNLKIAYIEVGRGYAIILAIPEPDLTLIDIQLKQVNLGLIEDQNELLVSKIRKSVFEYLNNVTSIQDHQKLSDYIANDLAMNYAQLSKLFKKLNGQTIEQFYIQMRTEKVMDLIRQAKLNNSQIAHALGYSGIQYLSGQFKKVTGMTLTDYRKHWNQFITEKSDQDHFKEVSDFEESAENKDVEFLNSPNKHARDFPFINVERNSEYIEKSNLA